MQILNRNLFTWYIPQNTPIEQFHYDDKKYPHENVFGLSHIMGNFRCSISPGLGQCSLNIHSLMVSAGGAVVKVWMVNTTANFWLLFIKRMHGMEQTPDRTSGRTRRCTKPDPIEFQGLPQSIASLQIAYPWYTTENMIRSFANQQHVNPTKSWFQLVTGYPDPNFTVRSTPVHIHDVLLASTYCHISMMFYRHLLTVDVDNQCEQSQVSQLLCEILLA